MKISKIIESIKKLDLSTYPKDEVLYLFNKVGEIAFINLTFHKGKSIIRARPNFNGKHFEKKSDYSYKPQSQNTKYQRASTPNKTMFYGSVVPDFPKPGELDNMRVTSLIETLQFLNDKSKSGYQKISFGRWEVNEDINLIAIVQEDKYYSASSYLSDLADAYYRFINSMKSEFIIRSFAFTKFLAEEFSKEKIRGDYDYLISALFSEKVTENGFDGIFYPSVRTGGQGFNIAITPEATNKMSLIAAGECTVYKLRDHTVVGNDAGVKLNGTEDSFKLIELDSQREACLFQLGISSLNELK